MVVIVAIRTLPYALHSVLDLRVKEECGNFFPRICSICYRPDPLLTFFSFHSLNLVILDKHMSPTPRKNYDWKPVFIAGERPKTPDNLCQRHQFKKSDYISLIN